MSDYKPDDPRYAQLKRDWGEDAPRRLFVFLQAQAAAGATPGCSEKDEVYREDKLTLYHYRPIAPSANLPSTGIGHDDCASTPERVAIRNSA